MSCFSCCMMLQFLNSYWSHHVTCSLLLCLFFCFTFRVLSILILKKAGLLFLERHADWATFHLILTETHWNIITCMPTRRPSVPNTGSSKWKSVLLEEKYTLCNLYQVWMRAGWEKPPLCSTRCRSHPISAVSNGQQWFTPQLAHKVHSLFPGTNGSDISIDKCCCW